jgi:hypothetical protein
MRTVGMPSGQRSRQPLTTRDPMTDWEMRRAYWTRLHLALLTRRGMRREHFWNPELPSLLNQVGVELLDINPPVLLCLHCCTRWTPRDRGGRWPFGWYRCPHRCRRREEREERRRQAEWFHVASAWPEEFVPSRRTTS